jgi:hypothetical protein
MGPAGLGINNDYAGEGQQQFSRPSVRPLAETAPKIEIYTSFFWCSLSILNSSELNSFGSGTLPQSSIIFRNNFSKLCTSELILK